YGSTSSQVSQSSGDICRICHCESDTHNPLLTPCYCSGSLKFVHQTCLQQWLTASETNSCELCKFPFIMHTKIKPFNEWRSLDMSGVERRRLCCAVLFHCAAGLCVIWSLCVLIERAAEEVRRGQIGWPFWTKLIVVTVGLTGGVVFMYIQCKQYLNLCNRWRARNRILLIQNVPEKVHPPQSPQMPQFRRVQTAATSGQPLGGGTMGINAVNNAVTASVAAAAAAAAAARQSSYDHPLGAATVNVSLGGGGPSTGGGGGNHCELQLNQQGQIIAANIESNSIGGYDRDWTLDDISQVSFKPCLQGSGSLTPMPFHDSVHNICETTTGSGSGIMVMSATSTTAGGGGGGTATSSSTITTNGNGSTHRYSTVSSSSNPGGAEQNTNSVGKSITGGGGPELSLLTKLNNGAAERSRSNSPNVVPRPEAGPTPGAMGRYVNSAIFLENRDILNDPALGPTGRDEPPASKLHHRHSTVLSGGGAAAAAPPPPVGMAAGFGREEALATQSVATEPSKTYRRYSDTKLLQKQSLSFPQEPLALCEIGTHTKDQLLLNPKSIIYDMTSLLGPAHALQTTDIQFESGAPLDDDALEMNIQDILEYDQLQQQQQQQQQHYYAPDKHSPRALVEQRLSLENILQSSYHDDPGAVPVRPYYDHHGHSMLSLSLASKTPPPHPPSTLLSGAAGVGSHVVVAPPQIVPPTLSTDYPYPRSTMAGTVVVAESPYQQQQQQQQQMHPQLQQQRSHCCGETVDASRFASDSNKLKLFKSLPNLSASSENLLP
uniref:Uncharacterized protein n=1 Tax=Anopheles melas TaxID=34690 RepID=A0A182UJN3_9DIPT